MILLPPVRQEYKNKGKTVLEPALVGLPEGSPSHTVIAHEDQGRVAQQVVLVEIGEEVVVGVVAELRVLDEVVGQAGLPEKAEVRLRRELFGDLARVVQQIVEVVARAQAEVRVEFVRVADFGLCRDAKGP